MELVVDMGRGLRQTTVAVAATREAQGSRMTLTAASGQLVVAWSALAGVQRAGTLARQALNCHQTQTQVLLLNPYPAQPILL